MEKTAKQIFFELKVKELSVYENYKKPLKKILLEFHNKCINNYVNTISSIPGSMPMELKKSIVSFL